MRARAELAAPSSAARCDLERFELAACGEPFALLGCMARGSARSVLFLEL